MVRVLRTFFRRHLSNLCVSFMTGHRNEHEVDVHRQRAQIAPLPVLRPRGGQVNFGRDGQLTSAAAALAMKSIDRFARQSLTAGPFSRELRAPYCKEVFRPRFWPLPIADATSAQSLQKDSKNVLRSRTVVARRLSLSPSAGLSCDVCGGEMTFFEPPPTPVRRRPMEGFPMLQLQPPHLGKDVRPAQLAGR